MSEQSLDTTRVLFVAGGGARVKESSVMYTFMRRAVEKQGLAYDCVDGTHEDDRGNLFVSPPSQQLRLIEAKLNQYRPEDRVLIVSQCLGTVASLAALENSWSTGRATRLLTISPPLPSPYKTMQNPRSKSKRADGVMKTWDLPEDGSLSIDEDIMTLRLATVPKEYELEHSAVSDTFHDRLRYAVESGEAMAVATEADWNVYAKGVMAKWGGHVLELAKTGHSLNPSNGVKLSYEELLVGQESNARMVINQGLQFLDSTTKTSK